MPISLTNPIQGPAVTRKEITAFSVNLQDGVVSMTFAGLTETGEAIGSETFAASLYQPNGTPRFAPALYAEIKSALYAIAIEDGHVVGVVE